MDAAPPQVFQPGHFGDGRGVAVGVAQVQVLQPRAAEQGGVIPYRGDEQLQIGQIFQPCQGGKIPYIGIRQHQIAQLFHISGPFAAADPAVAQVDALHVDTVFQLVHIRPADQLVLGDGGKPGIVRPGGQRPQLHPPDKAYFGMSLAQGGHGLAFNATVAQDHFAQIGQIGQQRLDLRGAVHGNAGKIQLRSVGLEAYTSQLLLPQEAAVGMLRCQGSGLVGGDARAPQVNVGGTGEPGQGVTQRLLGARPRRGGALVAAHTHAAQLHGVFHRALGQLPGQRQQRRVVPAQSGVHPPQPGQRSQRQNVLLRELPHLHGGDTGVQPPALEGQLPQHRCPPCRLGNGRVLVGGQPLPPQIQPF